MVSYAGGFRGKAQVDLLVDGVGEGRFSRATFEHPGEDEFEPNGLIGVVLEIAGYKFDLFEILGNSITEDRRAELRDTLEQVVLDLAANGALDGYDVEPFGREDYAG